MTANDENSDEFFHGASSSSIVRVHSNEIVAKRLSLYAKVSINNAPLDESDTGFTFFH